MANGDDIDDDNLDEGGGTDLAVVGVACRFPGAKSPQEYWENLRDGKESVVPLTDAALAAAGVSRQSLRDPAYVKAAAVLDDVDQFDPGFFGFSPREAQVLDPQHRFFLEVCWEALESAGHMPESFDGQIGVFGGSGHNAYMPYNLFTNPKLMESMGLFLVRHTGNDKDFLTTRASYCLDLHGPAVNVQTACSTSLVAIHLAAQSLLGGECDMALAGGVTIELPHAVGYKYEEGEILSPDGHCRAFDHKSAGTVFGSGCGIVALRRLEDAQADGDTIFGVVKSTAINNDGSRKVGYLAPSVDGQAEAIVEAINLAGLEARDISYVECHGTGTPVGDPIEVTALTQAFRTMTEDNGFCRLGSVKTNIGHLDTAAGVASFIKVIQMLRHSQMAPTLHYEAPNPQIDFETSPFLVNDRLRPWTSPSSLRRAGVSSLGVGGTNAHIIVEEAPSTTKSSAPARGAQLLVVSGRTPRALEANIRRLTDYLESDIDHALGAPLADAAHTLLVGRRRFGHRRAVVVRDGTAAAAAFAEKDVRAQAKATSDVGNAKVAFLFPGGGAQFPGMMREVYDAEPAFKSVLDRCLAHVKKHENIDLAPLMFPPVDDEKAFEAAANELQKATRALPALFSVEVALAALWESLGVAPSIAIGHSLGEYAAAYLAGVFSLEDALGIVCCRGRLFEACPPGAMSAVPLSESAIAKTLPKALDIAVVNGPESCVVSGPKADLEKFEGELETQEVDAKRLAIEVAAHSRMLDAVLAEFRTFLSKVKFSNPSEDRPFISNLSGAVAGDEVATADYWAKHLRSTVRFADGMSALLSAHPDVVLLEVGPGQALTQISRMQDDLKEPFRAVPSGRHPKDEATSELDHVFLAAGRLWCAGVDLDAEKLMGGGRKRIQLPTYAFDHERHWVEPGDGFFLHQSDEEVGRTDDVGAWFAAPVFHPESLEDAPAPTPSTVVLLSDGTSLASALADELRRNGLGVVVVAKGDGFLLDGETARVNPDRASDYEALFVALTERGETISRVVNCWSFELAPPTESVDVSQVAFDAGAEHQARPAEVLKALDEADLADGVHYLHLTQGAFAADDDDTIVNPFGALALGPCRVVPKELPNLRATLLDLDSNDPQRLVDDVVAEILSGGESALTLLRPGKRWVETWNAIAAPAPEAPIDVEGAVVITGGLGGIGKTIALALASPKTHFIMVGRTRLPPPSEWSAYLAANEGGSVCSKILAAKAIEAKGAKVTSCAADVTDALALKAAIDAAADGMVVRGVIHAAGVLDDKPFVTKTRPEMEAVLAPKVAGLLALEAAVDLSALTFFVAFSSTSVPLGPPGQIDYVAANAFLNARMKQLAGRGIPAKALGWGVWRDVGMAASAGRDDITIKGEAVDHPLLQRRSYRDDTHVTYEAIYSEAMWVLDEHRVKGEGAVVPGTALLEIIRAAAADAFFDADPVNLTNIQFLRPLALDDGAPRKVVVEVERKGNDEVRVQIFSDSDQLAGETHDSEARLRAEAKVLRTTKPATTARVDIRAERERHPEGLVDFGDRRAILAQEKTLDFGPRWDVLREMRFGDHRAMATLTISDAYVSDLEDHVIHAGLWDIASGFAFPRFPSPGENAIYVPVGYQSVNLIKPPPARVTCLLRFGAGSDANRVNIDYRLVDERGDVVVEVEGYEVAAVPAAALSSRRAAPASLLDTLLEDGITAEEGADAFMRALSLDVPVAIASPIPLDSLATAFAPKAPSTSTGASEGSASPKDGGPRDDTERMVLGLFRDLLGADQATIGDSFFDLGGHSLIAVRLFSKIKKQSGVDLPIGSLFTTPTAESLAAEIRDSLGIVFEPDADVDDATVRTPKAARGPKCLVPINAGTDDTPAFFCVHGAGGNVLNFSDLSRHLGKEVAFYGLQAQGVDGKEEPLHSVEEMATSYLEGVRFARPTGPYVLGGYSGGGAVALEMAKRLRADGETVKTVVFLDTFRPGIGMRRPSMKKRIDDAKREGLAYIPNKIRARVQRQWREASLEVQRRIFERAGAPPPIEIREYQLTNAFAAAADRYQPSNYDGKVVLFRAEKTDAVYQHSGPTLGWDGITTDLTIHEVPGDHDSVTREPNIFSWIGLLRDVIVGTGDA